MEDYIKNNFSFIFVSAVLELSYLHLRGTI